MDDRMREKLLKVALITFGVIFFTIYPLGLVWPSGWLWHGGHGQYYLQMICGIYAVLGAYLIAAARNPSEHRSLISFTVWSSVVHAGIMATQAMFPHCCWSPPYSGISPRRGDHEPSRHRQRRPASRGAEFQADTVEHRRPWKARHPVSSLKS
jgi:Family of unknown function (DUF6632)